MSVKVIEQLITIQWWNWPNDIVVENAVHIVKNNIDKLLEIKESLQ